VALPLLQISPAAAAGNILGQEFYGPLIEQMNKYQQTRGDSPFSSDFTKSQLKRGISFGTSNADQ
jgi:hypothetical protein